MNYKEIETSKGVLKYRMPNILEAYDLLDTSGIQLGVSTLKLKRNIIDSMGPMIDYSGIEGVDSYQNLLTMVDDMVMPLGAIADEIIMKTFDAFKKKNT